MSKKKYDLLIGIPCRNEENTIEAALLSVLKAVTRLRVTKRPLVSVAVCLNGTTDHTEVILNRLQQKHDFLLLHSEPGKVQAMEVLCTQIPTQSVVFVDADGILDEDALLFIHERLQAGALCVSGNPTPFASQSWLDSILNVRRRHPQVMRAPRPFQGFHSLHHCHGRFFALAKPVLSRIPWPEMRLARSDDIFLSHWFLHHYPRKYLVHESRACIRYTPVLTLRSWISKHTRFWDDAAYIYRQFPKYHYLAKYMFHSLNWRESVARGPCIFAQALAESIACDLLHIGFKIHRFIFPFRPQVTWKRLPETKQRTFSGGGKNANGDEKFA